MTEYKGCRLSDKQRKWRTYYAQGKTPEEAAELAGYKEKGKHSFASIGWRNVKKLVQDGEGGTESSGRIAMEEINSFWMATMKDESAALQHRLKASELRAKTAGGFADNTSIHVTGGVVFIAGEDKIED